MRSWCDIPRDVVRVHGPDAASYLQSQVSQDLRPMAVGERRWAFLLQPTGKVDVLLRVSRTADDEFVLDTDGGYGRVMIDRLNRFRIRVKAEVEPLPWRCLTVLGEGEWGEHDVLGEDPRPPAGAPQGTADDVLRARIEAAWPAMGAEIVPGETIPAETGVTDVAVSFTKGCYPGQELVERMDSRAVTAPRLLRRLARAEAVAMGARVTSEAGDVVLALVPRAALNG